MRCMIWAALVCTIVGCANSQRLCKHIHVQDGTLDLSANEKVLICGTDREDDGGWSSVPIPQAQYQLNVILQDRGYLAPKFERSGDDLTVWVGPQTKIKELVIQGGEGVVDAKQKRQVVGESLTREKLDEVQAWAEQQLRTTGFACPQVSVRAEAWNQKIIVDINAGPRSQVGNIAYEGLEGLEPQALARFEALEPGQRYDVRASQLTINRLLADGILQSATYRTKCHDERVDLRLMASTGRPRVLRLSFGANTEEFPFGRVWFKNSRLDGMASNYTASLYASPRVQSAEISAELYRLPMSKRTYIGPRLVVNRDSETIYEVVRSKMGLDLGRFWDQWHARWQARVGPTLNYVDTLRGVGPNRTSYVSWEAMLSAMSHDYEYGVRTQFDGWVASLLYRGQREGVGSPINVDALEFSGKHLWNLGQYLPPLIVLGTRVQAQAAQATQGLLADASDLLPIEYRAFLGGDQNLRGFSRKNVSNDGRGFLTSVYAGFELRLIEELPYRLEPFLLADFARVGQQAFTLSQSTFVSTGVGLRWASPVGTLRGTLARGQVLNEDQLTTRYAERVIAFVSFGQEF